MKGSLLVLLPTAAVGRAVVLPASPASEATRPGPIAPAAMRSSSHANFTFEALASAPPPATTNCTLPPSAPSLAPAALFGGASRGGSFWRVESRNVSVSPFNSTIFHFAVPHSFPFAAPAPSSTTTSPPAAGVQRTDAGARGDASVGWNPDQRCALQFRFPSCDSLAPGYPCFSWTGLEQMVMSRSGMRFAAWSPPDALRDWRVETPNGDVQPSPGDRVTVGTFLCGGQQPAAGGDQGRVQLAWLGESFKGYSLDYLQAGGSSGFSDGVGLFVVACA